MRRLFCLALVLAVVGIASASNLLFNPGFEDGDGSINGWNTWNAKIDEGEWGTDYSGDITFSNDSVSGDYSVLINCNTEDGFAQQFGIYQVVDVSAGTKVQLTGMWKADLGTNGWAELKIATAAPGVVFPNFLMDATKNYAAKIDTYGYNERLDAAWNWESTLLAPMESGDTIVSQGQVIVYTEMGGWGTESVLQLDNMSLVVVPEPMTIALLGLGALGLIRRKK
jgi:hypothetical protein